MTPKELQAILDKHQKWLSCEDGGERADLQYADLQSANLQDANLQNANLQSANLQGANLQNANLQNADLQSANLDFSCWPLWCGSFGVKVDRRIFVQLLFHLLKVECDDPSVKKVQGMETLIKLANEFHRTDCDKIGEKE